MMDTKEMLTIFNKHRGDAIVVPGRGGKHWVDISTRRNRDVELGDPSMGGHGAFGMGLALAQPNQKIVLFDSDGDIQMSMGNTGHHRRAAAEELLSLHARQRVLCHHRRAAGAAREDLKYHDVARACGYPRAYAYDNLETFSINVERILSEPGPVFIALKVKPDVENKPIGSRVKWRKRSQAQVVQDLKKELGIA
jgi:thiamine pyrophosphate-dependent acetolactate synthase large subunit-like protein